MKRILFLVCTALAMAGCSESDSQKIINSNKELSEVKITENIYKYGKPASEETFEIYTYNEKGNLIRKYTNHYYAQIDKRSSETTIYGYDNKGKLTEESNNDKRIEYVYNDIDSISEKNIYSESGLSEIYNYEYNNNRRLSKEVEKDIWVNDNFGYIRIYSYSGNNITVDITNKKDGSVFGQLFREYDSHNNFMKETFTEPNGKKVVQDKYSYQYDNNDRISKKSHNIIGDDREIDDYSYNEDGTIHKIHISFSYKSEERDLLYYYTYK